MVGIDLLWNGERNQPPTSEYVFNGAEDKAKYAEIVGKLKTVKKRHPTCHMMDREAPGVVN